MNLGEAFGLPQGRKSGFVLSFFKVQGQAEPSRLLGAVPTLSGCLLNAYRSIILIYRQKSNRCCFEYRQQVSG